MAEPGSNLLNNFQPELTWTTTVFAQARAEFLGLAWGEHTSFFGGLKAKPKRTRFWGGPPTKRHTHTHTRRRARDPSCNKWSSRRPSAWIPPTIILEQPKPWICVRCSVAQWVACCSDLFVWKGSDYFLKTPFPTKKGCRFFCSHGNPLGI